jgi:hypothetical protein
MALKPNGNIFTHSKKANNIGSHKLELSKDTSEIERFSFSDARIYSSLEGLYLPTSSALKIWSKCSRKLCHHLKGSTI